MFQREGLSFSSENISKARTSQLKSLINNEENECVSVEDLQVELLNVLNEEKLDIGYLISSPLILGQTYLPQLKVELDNIHIYKKAVHNKK